MNRPTILLTSGTRGDVEPLLALGLGLQQHGREVRLVAPPTFARQARNLGIPFAALEGNPSDLLTAPGGQKALTLGASALTNLRATLRYLKLAGPIYTRMLNSAWQACQGAGLVVVGLPSLWGVDIAQALGVPCVGAFLQPLTPTTAFPATPFPFQRSLGPRLNRLTYSLLGLALRIPWRKLMNTWRMKILGLPRLSLTGLQPDPYGPLTLQLCAFSPLIVPRPVDWPTNVHITGFWRLPLGGYTPSPALLEFINQGPPPVFIGFGSPGVENTQQALKLILAALELSRLRAVLSLPVQPNVLQPEVDGSAKYLSGSVMAVNQVPHDWLFPKLVGVVHHGGAGTTAAGLLAGVPTLVIPLAGDQFFWAGRIQALKVGPPPIPRRTLTVDRLAEGLRSLVDNVCWREHASAMGAAIRQEDGASEASRLLTAIY